MRDKRWGQSRDVKSVLDHQDLQQCPPGLIEEGKVEQGQELKQKIKAIWVATRTFIPWLSLQYFGRELETRFMRYKNFSNMD